MTPAPGRLLLLFLENRHGRASDLPEQLPLLHDQEGELNEFVLAYLLGCWRGAGKAPGSLRDVAYILREWHELCLARRRQWDRPRDEWLWEWRDDMLGRKGDEAVGTRRIGHKTSVVFEFYLRLPDYLSSDGRNAPRRGMVADPGHAVRPGEGMLTCRLDDGKRVWSGRRQTDPAWPRKTPEEAEVAEVLSRLRTRAERDYLSGRCMAHAGLRAHEAARLSLTQLWEALCRALPCLRDADRQDWRRLDEMAADAALQWKLIEGLDARRRPTEQWLSVMVTGKRGKARLVGFPLDLVRELLDVGVFVVRRQQLEHWRCRGWDGKPPAALFLSNKSRRGILAGSLEDIVADAFNDEPRIEGSAQRLRAHYCVQTAVRIFGDLLDANGGFLTGVIQDTALDRIAEALGHSKLSTTVRFYLSIAQAYHEARRTADPVAVLARALAVVDVHLSLSGTSLLLRAAMALGAAADNGPLPQALGLILCDPDIAGYASGGSVERAKAA